MLVTRRIRATRATVQILIIAEVIWIKQARRCNLIRKRLLNQLGLATDLIKKRARFLAQNGKTIHLVGLSWLNHVAYFRFWEELPEYLVANLLDVEAD